MICDLYQLRPHFTSEIKLIDGIAGLSSHDDRNQIAIDVAPKHQSTTHGPQSFEPGAFLAKANSFQQPNEILSNSVIASNTDYPLFVTDGICSITPSPRFRSEQQSVCIFFAGGNSGCNTNI